MMKMFFVHDENTQRCAFPAKGMRIFVKNYTVKKQARSALKRHAHGKVKRHVAL